MSGYVLPLQLTPTARGKGATLFAPGSTSLILTVRTPAVGTVGAAAGTAGSVLYELGAGGGAAPQWDGNQRLALPGTTVRDIAFDWIRVWAAATDAPQFVTAECDG